MRRPISPTENQIKTRLLNELRRSGRISETTVLANELPIGTAGVRADLAFKARYFCGVEIKSERDTLKRLERQLEAYQQFFDRTILVIANKHWTPLQTLDLNLDSIELWVASGLSLRRESKGAVFENSKKRDQILTKPQHKKLTGSTDNINSELFSVVYNNRFRATSQTFWNATYGRRIEQTDLALLSRFGEKRHLASELKTKQHIEKQEWEHAMLYPTHSSSVS